MGLFGKKKTPAEILAQGRNLYDQGEYGQAALVLLKASGKENGEVDYWLGRCYMAIDAKKPDRSPGKNAKQFLKFAAKSGHEEAARLLASEFGIPDYLPQEAAPQPAPEPAPQPVSAPAPQGEENDMQENTKSALLERF